MKQIKLFLLLAGSLSISLSAVHAQDIIVKTNNDSIQCIVKEIGDDEVKYINPALSETVLFGIDKNEVKLVRLANGNILEFSHSLYGESNYVSDKKHNLKVNFLSPLFNSTNICYERSIKPGHSFETTIGLIGVGWDAGDNNDEGVFVKMGYKFIKSPDYYIKGQRFAHILKGAYFRPELAISYYSYDNYDYFMWIGEESTRETNLMAAVLLNLGKQWVMENGFVIDWFGGVGYGFGKNDKDHGLHKAFIGGVDEFPLVLTMGLRVGWNF